MSSVVRTVLGDIAPAQLGVCDAHEHLFLATPVLAGEELDDAGRVGEELATLASAGAAAVVDWTPIALGRRPEALAQLSRASGVHVIAASGYHREPHYPATHWVWREPVEALAELIVHDIAVGIDAGDWCGPRQRATAVRAGVIKLAGGYQRVSPRERRLLEAGALAALRTGAPVCVHTEHGTHGLELVELLDGLGVPAARLVLAHLDRNPDAGLHAEVAATGAYLEYDGPGRAKHHPDAALVALIAELDRRGHGDRLLLGGDTARRSAYRSFGGGPGLDYALGRFAPRLRRELGDALAQRIFVDNPARAFAFAPLA